jgi:AcrR family transcriptional regulator
VSTSADQRDAGRAERRDQIRRRLLQAVDELTVAGESYATVSIERLVSAAGISRATFYTYFDGKGDLLRAWLAETLAALQQACVAWLALDAGATEDDLRAALRQILETYRRRATLMTAINDEATQDSSLREQLGTAAERAVTALAAQIRRGQRAGWIDDELLAVETAAWLIWLIERGCTEIVPAAGDDQLRALTDTLAAMAFRTLWS